jgi:hypothetical protein
MHKAQGSIPHPTGKKKTKPKKLARYGGTGLSGQREAEAGGSSLIV